MGAVTRSRTALSPTETVTVQERATATGGWTTLAADVIVCVLRIPRRGTARPSLGQAIMEREDLPELALVIYDSFLTANRTPALRRLTEDDQIVRAGGEELKVVAQVAYPAEQHLYCATRGWGSPQGVRR